MNLLSLVRHDYKVYIQKFTNSHNQQLYHVVFDCPKINDVDSYNMGKFELETLRDNAKNLYQSLNWELTEDERT